MNITRFISIAADWLVIAITGTFVVMNTKLSDASVLFTTIKVDL